MTLTDLLDIDLILISISAHCFASGVGLVGETLVRSGVRLMDVEELISSKIGL